MGTQLDKPKHKYNQVSTCHPEIPHKGHGLCDRCWAKKRYDGKWGDKAREYGRANNRRVKTKKYGLTVADYDRILLEQGGGCAICGRPQIGNGTRSFDIDHDHKTMKARGLLCNLCNTAIGKFEDNPALLRRAAEYLEKHKIVSAHIDGQPVSVSRMESGDVLVSFDPWTNWGHGPTLEAALDDLVDSTREIKLGPWTPCGGE